MVAPPCGRISKVFANSLAAKAGIQPGDEIISIKGNPVRDVLEYRYLTSDSFVTIVIRRNSQKYACFILKEADEDLGLEFERDLFDGLRLCNNRCIFCFLQQMPPGLRKSLYIRDDDYRLSLAHGNYITLTNLKEDDFNRICSQRMGPLYISVHATNPKVRVKMLGNLAAGRVMDQLKRLADARILMHCQIVICPEINDGECLEQSVRDLVNLHPWIASVAVIPVGLTRHREGLPFLRSVTPHEAKAIVTSCISWQREFLSKIGTRFVFPSDEMYFLSGIDIPPCECYEGFPQLEDGVGITRLFLDELHRLANVPLYPKKQGRYLLVTGVLAAPLVQQLAYLLNKVEGIEANLSIIENKFLGNTITVSGLLSGRDIIDTLGQKSDTEVLVPSVALKGTRFLDGVSVRDIEMATGARVRKVAPWPSAVVRLLAKRN